MNLLYSKGSNNSFFKKKQDRIIKIIEEKLFELVLQYLPHLQLTTDEQEDMWELVAIKINDFYFRQTFNLCRQTSEKLEELPIFNGDYVKNVFISLYDKFIRELKCCEKVDSLRYATPDEIKFRLKKRKDFLLYQIDILKFYDVELMSKLSKENFEKAQRERQNLTCVNCAEKKLTYDSGAGKLLSTSKNMLYNEKLVLLNEKIKFYESELHKMEQKVDDLKKKNKTLLEFNHDLISKSQNRSF